jgi:hypothetical protein
MKTPLRLRDLMTVDPTDGSYDYDPLDLMINAYRKRKKGPFMADEGAETDESTPELKEVLTAAQRMARRASFRRNKSALRIGRARSLRRRASNVVLKARALRAARAEITKRLTGGKNKGDLSFGARAGVEKQLARKKTIIKSLAARLLPQVRAKDAARFQRKK